MRHENGESGAFWSTRVSVAQRVSELRNRYTNSFRSPIATLERRTTGTNSSGTSVAAIKLRLFSQGLKIDTIPLKRKTNRYRDYLLQKIPPQQTLESIWSTDDILVRVFRQLNGRDLLSCSTVCKKWFEILEANGYMGRVRAVISFRQPCNIETCIRMAYQRHIQSVRLFNMTNDLMPTFVNSFANVFHEFFPECCVKSKLTCDSSMSQLGDFVANAASTFQSAPELVKRKSVSNVRFHSCANSEVSSIMTEVSYDSIFETSTTSSLENSGYPQFNTKLTPAFQSATEPDHRHITNLTIDNCSLSDKSLEQLIFILHAVTHLSIFGCNDLTEIGLWVCLRPWMTHLNVRDCINFSDESLGAVVQLMPNIRELSLQVSKLLDQIKSNTVFIFSMNYKQNVLYYAQTRTL